MYKISQIWNQIQRKLFPTLEEELGPLSNKERKLISTLELVRIEDFVRSTWWIIGRPESDRKALARSFVAKMVYDMNTTAQLRERVKGTPTLRRICGWERKSDIPSESTFSRAFDKFAQSELAQRVHAALIENHQGIRLVGHISRDSADVPAREKAVAKVNKEACKAESKGKRGRRKKGEVVPAKEPTRLERQVSGMSLKEMLVDLPQACDWGTKKKNGSVYHWKGYKLHVDWADGEIPISAVLTSASVNDSQVAIPLSQISASRVTSLYGLMDSAYDAKEIWEHSRQLGHVPIIDRNRRRSEKVEMDPATARRFDERSTCERGFSLLKDTFGGRNVRVRGAAKVMAHLMFGLLALTADRLLALVT